MFERLLVAEFPVEQCSYERAPIEPEHIPDGDPTLALLDGKLSIDEVYLVATPSYGPEDDARWALVVDNLLSLVLVYEPIEVPIVDVRKRLSEVIEKCKTNDDRALRK
jgi:hypothetical protein